jgi:hypothetical protein
LERDLEGRITINLQEPENPTVSNRKNRKIPFLQARSSPKGRAGATGRQSRTPLQGFIGATYNDDQTGDLA